MRPSCLHFAVGVICMCLGAAGGWVGGHQAERARADLDWLGARQDVAAILALASKAQLPPAKQEARPVTEEEHEPEPEPPLPRDFESAARRIIRTIVKGDTEQLARVISRNGVQIVRRRWASERDRDNYRDPDSAAATAATSMRMDGLSPLIWEDISLEYPRPGLKSADFRRLARVFQKLITATPPPFVPMYSLDMVDHWQARHLGAGVSGRICSNAEWYVCMAREKGSWRVHRMELATH